jgi:hypothetical protein
MLNLTHIPAHLYVSIINGHNTWLAPLLGVAGLIVGALITGGLSLYKDHYRHKKKKLATAYAFKGEISVLLDIIKKREYIEKLNEKIEELKMSVKRLDGYFEKYIKEPEEFKSMIRYLGTTPIYRFTFVVNEDIFYVKNSLKKDIGLLDDISIVVIRFYSMANALLLDLIENNKSNDEINSKFWKIPEKDVLNTIYSYYGFFNVQALAKKNLELHESMLEISKAIIESGNKSVEDLNDFIKKNNFWCKRILNFLKCLLNRKKEDVKRCLM